MIRVCVGQHICACPCSTGHVIQMPTCHQPFQQQEEAFEDEAECERPPLQWCQCTAASALVEGWSWNQKLAGGGKIKNKAEVRLPERAEVCLGVSRRACGVITIKQGHRSGQGMRRMRPTRGVRHESQKRSIRPWQPGGGCDDVFAAAYFRRTARMRGDG